ncbi:hypothetical protein K3172_08620 [Qipengyuania sp. 6B39]|uniref:hypothetical protein n=1 Tax=Qipengyuania proteolytica TaxID=2867239 RepID=UPI001C8A4789|nr:hypothetical protein [Qipengyuania proteolytica]MBX7495915.1 hypothetical protein [Qipengyuania proteolytica]
MKSLAASLFALPLAACAIIPDTPRVDGEAAAQGTPVGIDQAVWAGDAILKPVAVVEDSRCPVNARCVWAGKITVSTRITSTHWAQTAPLTLGEPYEVLGRTYVLVSASPDKTTDREIPVGEYRFVFERR